MDEKTRNRMKAATERHMNQLADERKGNAKLRQALRELYPRQGKAIMSLMQVVGRSIPWGKKS